MDKLILEVFIHQGTDGVFVIPKFADGAKELMERWPQDAATIGEAIAAFGEQLKMEGLKLTKQGPALLYGPNGRPVA